MSRLIYIFTTTLIFSLSACNSEMTIENQKIDSIKNSEKEIKIENIPVF